MFSYALCTREGNSPKDAVFQGNRNKGKINEDRELLLPDSIPPIHQNGDYLKSSNGSDVVIPGFSNSETPNVVLQWKNISVFVAPGEACFSGKVTLADKPIIAGVSGIAYPGTLLAIMGASGSGKTTLLNALTLRSQSHLLVDGQVLVNGKKVTPGKMDALSAYVQQDDLFFGKLTVKEQLNFHALLRLDSSITKSQRQKRIKKVVSELGLANCQNSLIGVPGRIQGLSGGERRRLAFACEVLSDPPLLFCDEPTSGLDAAMSQNLIKMLQKLAAKGKTILFTIHQPSSYQYVLFDRIMLMTAGKLAFLGTSNDALDFFKRSQYPCPENCSPPDHFIHVLSSGREGENGDAAMKICRAYASSQQEKSSTENQPWENGGMMEPPVLWSKFLPRDFRRDHVKQHSKRWQHIRNQVASGGMTKCLLIQTLLNGKDYKPTSYKAPISRQFCTVLWRSWLGVVRDQKLIIVKILTNLLTAFIMGTVYWDQKNDQLGVLNINAFFVIFLVLLMMQNVFSVLLAFSEEFPLFLREHWNGMYTTGIYVITKSLADLPEVIVLPFLQTVMTFWMMGITNSWTHLLLSSGITILIANASASFGYLLSGINSSLGGAVALIPLSLGPLITVSGFFINMRSIPWYFRWIQYISVFKYGTEALTINQWRDVTHIECTINNSTCPRNGNDILHFLDYDPDNITTDLIGLLTLTIVYRLIATVVLSVQAWRTH